MVEGFFFSKIKFAKMIITFRSLFIIYIIDLASKISHSGPTLLRLCYILSGSQSDIDSEKPCSTQTPNPFSTIKLKNTPFLAKRFFFQDSTITCPYYKESRPNYRRLVEGISPRFLTRFLKTLYANCSTLQAWSNGAIRVSVLQTV